jgi:hypothetical protein
MTTTTTTTKETATRVKCIVDGPSLATRLERGPLDAGPLVVQLGEVRHLLDGGLALRAGGVIVVVFVVVVVVVVVCREINNKTIGR